MSCVEQAIWLFAAERFERLAQQIAAELENFTASGIYGDDAEDFDGNSLQTLWDEFRYEVEFGPHDQLDSAWRETIRPFLETAIASVPLAEQRLLFLATDEGMKFDADCEEMPPLDGYALMDELSAALRNFAGRDRKNAPTGDIRDELAIEERLLDMQDNQFVIDPTDLNLIKHDVVRLFKTQLPKLSPCELRSVAALLLGLDRLPSVTPALDVDLIFSQPNTDGNYGWAMISLSEDEFRLGTGEHFYDSAVGGDTETATVFEALAGSDFSEGDIELWLEYANARIQDGSLGVDQDNTDYATLDWSDSEE